MTKYYPTRNDLDKPDKMERVVKDIYDRIYRKQTGAAANVGPRRINVNSATTEDTTTTATAATTSTALDVAKALAKAIIKDLF